MKVKELRALPHRRWDEQKTYQSIMVIPSGKKHDSGWALMYVIGCNGEEKEIAASCDDIEWNTEAVTDHRSIRTDMFYPSGVMHFWSQHFNFTVGCSLSSTAITLTKKI